MLVVVSHVQLGIVVARFSSRAIGVLAIHFACLLACLVCVDCKMMHLSERYMLQGVMTSCLPGPVTKVEVGKVELHSVSYCVVVRCGIFMLAIHEGIIVQPVLKFVNKQQAI